MKDLNNNEIIEKSVNIASNKYIILLFIALSAGISGMLTQGLHVAKPLHAIIFGLLCGIIILIMHAGLFGIVYLYISAKSCKIASNISGLELFIILLLISIITLVHITNTPSKKNVESKENESIKVDNIDLFKTYSFKNIDFIDEYGNLIFSIPKGQYDYIGDFNEGIMFAGKEEGQLQKGLTSYLIYKMVMYDNKGNFINELPYYVAIPESNVDGSFYSKPIIHNSYAKVLVLNDLHSTNINTI